ncbi:1-deoxy-D-xylulose-5-phosphate reductoisomerase [Roseomonas gilardii]|uniref:1-deoxy-D-xylulose 5-phosphate reductoisomerase n=1 Tax=Roseomonas gilardii TaxID=257708 RepID=A0A1L7AF40_9PROT|nr:1-deoxy-D-xylulose-5-phosphate reductoisomerase [Roseomonas gilardii]APT57427.1 1-deoxy-D-xylulose-5-phosphate reductoisomerase [Roseomonas gilardii]MDT8330562.1 1-deoxy-D-xylulose-5-phosphate reductoisomerase [Roseomonas gilardii]PZR18061.1 MAG: 1-deoxy-D-xylulose-5-phosphate reductoisomerase [Azospirillum brasilense]
MTRRITVLGSTGSVGKSTVALLEAAAPGEFAVEALVAGRDARALAEQARRLRPAIAVLADETCLPALREALAGSGIACAAGEAAVLEAASRPADWTMAAVVGAAGLRPTLAALRRGGTLALANKESLVCAGAIVMRVAREAGALLLPVDSEHNAIFQALDARQPSVPEKIILTASGGPFRQASLAEMAAATPEAAVRHPVWSMGAKISIDSATMFNKGLEVIEAAHLFPVPHERIEVLVHPQSAVHGLVQYADGSLIAQLGTPDMRTPIAHALSWPGRRHVDVGRLDLAALGRLEFFPPDPERFPALRLVREALSAGGGAPTILNAANEVAVARFLGRRLSFLGIARVVEAVMERLGAPAIPDLEAVLALDGEARRAAEAEAERMGMAA